jgi:alpha-L-rhamnosidase
MPPSPESNPEHKPIDWVHAYYDSIHGRIVSVWKREGGKFEFEVTIPANTTATVFLPAADERSINESGKPVGRAKGVKFLKMEGDRAVLEVEAGRYQFGTRL